MSEELINRTFLDRLTKIDDLILEQIKTTRDTNTALMSIAEALGVEAPALPGLPGVPTPLPSPIPEGKISNYPRSNKKELPSGITIINTKKGEVILPTDLVERMSLPIPNDVCRSILIYTNAELDLTLLNGDAVSFASTVFPTWSRIIDTSFDTIKIVTSSTTSIYLAVSAQKVPSIESISTSANKPTYYTSSQTVPSHGTAIQLPTKSIPDGYAVVIKAKRSNTGYIYHGESKSQAEAHNVELSKKDSFALQVDNINDIWIDSSVDDEGVEIFVEVEE